MGKKKRDSTAISRSLDRKIRELNKMLTQDNFRNFLEIIGSKKQIFWRNFMAGIARGIGIGIGVTIITAIIVIALQKIVTLNIPIIGEYISDIMQIVEKNKLR